VIFPEDALRVIFVRILARRVLRTKARGATNSAQTDQPPFTLRQADTARRRPLRVIEQSIEPRFQSGTKRLLTFGIVQ